MKLSSIILLILLVLFVTSIFATNLILKHQYEKEDKRDVYWNYTSIKEGNFKYLKINGGNITKIVYEPSEHSSVRLLNYWYNFGKDRVKANIKNDTLYLNFNNQYDSPGMRDWMKHKTLVRIFSPHLLAVNGNNTRVLVAKLNEKNFDVVLTGRSDFEIESYQPNFDSIQVSLKDSSEAEFEMSPDIAGSKNMYLKSLNASISGVSILDAGHFQINSAKYDIADTSAIVLSGTTLKKKW
jgi:hypothetical protein